MVLNYFDYQDGPKTEEQHKRIIAMAAALEIAKASASAPSTAGRSDKVENDLIFAAKEINTLAKAIQTFLDSGK